jgi:uncharacterized phage infection (PIP) family protein YhgE
MKPYFVLMVGLPEINIIDGKIDIEKVNTLKEAKSLIKTRMFDAVVVKNVLQDSEGHAITSIFPHYRTIVVLDSPDDSIKDGKNGVHQVAAEQQEIVNKIFEIISSYSSKNDDSLMVLLSIQDSIEELKTSSGFMKSSLNEVHTRLETLETNQNDLKSKFGKFSDQRIKAEQFFINTVTVLRGDLNELTEKVNEKERETETDRSSVEKVG